MKTKASVVSSSFMVMVLAMVTVIGLNPALGYAQNDALSFTVLGDAGEFAFGHAGQPHEPISVRTRLALNDLGSLSQLDTLWLAGFASEDQSAPNILSFVWAEDTSGWFPTWRLQLQINDDVLTFPDVNQSTNVVHLQSQAPEPGTVIETMLSYHPEFGRIDINLIDITKRQHIVSETLYVNSYDGPLYPVVGIKGQHKDVQLQAFDVARVGMPFGVPWEFLIEENGQFKSLLLRRLLVSDNLAFRFTADDNPYEGHFAIVADDGATEHTIADIPLGKQNGQHTVTFSAADLPSGSFNLVLQYVPENEDAWTLHTIPLHIVYGNVQANFQLLTFDGHTLQGNLIISSEDEQLQNVTLRIEATEIEYTADGRSVGKTRELFTQHIDRLGKEAQHIPFEIPIWSEDEIIGLILNPTFDIELGLIVSGDKHYIAR